MEIIVEKPLKWSQCEWEKENEDCFKDAEWFIEGGHYCQQHAEIIAQILRNEGHAVPEIGGNHDT